MPRTERLIVPDGIFHVTTHAVGAEGLFADRIDCADYLDRLATVCTRFCWDCLGFCLMGTHVHLLVRSEDGDRSKGMQWLNGTYARRFNKRHFRRGALHRGRYEDLLVETDTHLLEVIRYVALNPVRAGLCRQPEDWYWSSYAALIGMCKPLPFVDVDAVFELFSPRRTRAIALIREFVAGGLDRPLLAA